MRVASAECPFPVEPGQLVAVVRDDYSRELRSVRSKPWRLPGGGWVVQLEGITGGFDLDRIHAVCERCQKRAVPQSEWRAGWRVCEHCERGAA